MAIIYDAGRVRAYTAEVNARLDKCENGEGVECATIDSILVYCSRQCCEFAATFRQWGRDVFSGRVIFDPATELLWKAELHALIDRAKRLYRQGEQAEAQCWMLDGRRSLESALWNLNQLKYNWVTPKLSVGPSARIRFDEAMVEEGRKKLAQLTPLPKDWKPEDQQHAKLFR